MKMTGASKPASFKTPGKQGYKFKMKRTFGDGGMPMGAPPPMPAPGPAPMPAAAPQGGDPAMAIKQRLAAMPAKDRTKIKKLIKSKIKDAMRAQKQPAAQAAPVPPHGAPAPMPGMKRGGVVKKAIGGAVRGIGIARKGGGRGRVV